MKRLQTLFLASMVTVLSPVIAATNPFVEGEIKIEQTSSVSNRAEGAAVQTNEVQVSRSDLDKAIAKLQEANENYSKLLKKFAEDPNKFGDENGDYRDFIKQLELLSKRLTEIAERLKKASEQIKAEKNEKDEDKKDDADQNKVVEGTVRVGTSLNVRTSPWGNVIGSLHDGNKVKITGKSGDWYKIDYNGQTAYVHANYVDTAEKRAGTTPVEQPAAPAGNSTPPPANNVASGGGLTAAPCTPMPSRVSSEYGWRTHPTLGTRRFHDGIDLPIPNGTRLNALGNGTVVAVGYESGGGRYVKVRYDNGYESFYCHLQSTSVRNGQRVGAGQEVARSDNTGQWTTGPHLHFGLKRNGQSVNPRSAGIPLPR